MQTLLRSVGLFLLLFAITSLAVAQKTPTPQPVVVTNTSTTPVPVSGVVNLGNVNNPIPVVASGGAALPVAVQGTPSVNINSMPAVALGSGATVQLAPSTTVNTVDTTARSIVRLTGTFPNTPIQSSGFFVWLKRLGSNNNQYIVPSGKRLVITGVSVQIQVPAGEGVMDAHIFTNQADSPSEATLFRFVPQPTVSNYGYDHFTANATPNFYVDEGQSIGFGVSRRITAVGAPPPAYVYADCWGYLVDCGSGCTQ